MAKQAISNIKLGVFVLAGLLLLVFTLYMIGKNRNLFGNTIQLKAHFDDVYGLMPGNNVRFSGIQVGTVRKVNIINDTVIEVSMEVDEAVKKFIQKNAIVAIGTDGLMGNKVINISPAQQTSQVVSDGDILRTRKTPNTDEMLQTFYKTNNNLAVITEDLKTTVQRINNSKGLWSILNDSTLSVDLKASMINIRTASGQVKAFTSDLQKLIADVKHGKGSVGALLTDTSFSSNLNKAVTQIKLVSNNANLLAEELNKVVQEVSNGKGTVHALLKDSVLAVKLNSSLTNIEKGTAAFNENMEALKHSALLRGYFRNQEKQQPKKKKKMSKSDTNQDTN
ncbi:MlaD family protein [Solitalea lacus]|uniref:MlaD family protein n=1 Tax=Solitalea lacus TaxID=2911172 RepID=UPI001EDBDFF5|nr:MlaD family protein [Solitalea lacus]UKJ06699.1 MlaD family protein [Solitalea lacus]